MRLLNTMNTTPSNAAAPLCLTAGPEDAATRMDVFLARNLPELTRSAAERLLENGAVTCKGKALAKSNKPAAGDVIEVCIPAPVPASAAPQELPLDIVFEDDDLLVVNKAKGMVVHPAMGNPDGTLVNALLWHCGTGLSGINGVLRPGIVHRIDKDTSGLLIVAKNDHAHQVLAEQIKEHSCARVYEAVVHGNVKLDSGKVDAPIGRHPVERKRMAVTTKGARSAVTHYEVLERFGGFTHVRLRLETGRTHQIRVHMAYLGHPVAGDVVYGPKRPALAGGQCLHARCIGFTHPSDGRRIELSSDLPPYFTAFLARLRGAKA